MRLPLAALTIAGPGVAALAPYADLLRDEVNVKEVHLAESIDEFGTLPAAGQRARGGTASRRRR